MFRVAVLPGDGIGREIVPEGVAVLQEVANRYGVELSLNEGLIGGAALDAVEHPLPEATLNLCQRSDAILLGAVGGPKWDKLPVHLRPEAGALLPLRKTLNLYANLRPVSLFQSLVEASTLKGEVIFGTDMVVIRELTGGLYFGEKRREIRDGQDVAVDTLLYSRSEIERIVKLGFETARLRRKKLTSVDKANVLESSRFWREITDGLAKGYPDVVVEHMYVDNCAMQLVRDPRQFDVIVTENMFGDILTDLASMLTGSIGMLPSASLGGKIALYEPSHGSAPDIAGLGKANPLATILSVALMCRYSLNLPQAAVAIEKAVERVLAEGYRTADIHGPGTQLVTTSEMGRLVRERLE